MAEFTYQSALALITTALVEARRRQLPPMAVVVLDARGVIKAAVGEDGVASLRPTIAQGKANAALGMGFDTAEFERLRQAGVLSDAFSAALCVASAGEFNPNPGGVLIRQHNQVVGAIGASGAAAHEDDGIIRAALASY